MRETVALQLWDRTELVCLFAGPGRCLVRRCYFVSPERRDRDCARRKTRTASVAASGKLSAARESAERATQENARDHFVVTVYRGGDDEVTQSGIDASTQGRSIRDGAVFEDRPCARRRSVDAPRA